jgi:hypothetical protein
MLEPHAGHLFKPIRRVRTMDRRDAMDKLPDAYAALRLHDAGHPHDERPCDYFFTEPGTDGSRRAVWPQNASLD